MPRGSYDYRCDGRVFIIKWLDNAVVALASNTDTHLPEQTAIRRVGRNLEHVPQPMIVAKYNEGMGGVDAFDRFLASTGLRYVERNGGGPYLHMQSMSLLW
jgi:hypothetical protein